MDSFLNDFSDTYELILATLTYVFYFWPILGLYLVWETWLTYRRLIFINKLDWLLLEIKMPRIIDKPPQAMEVLLSIFNQARPGTFIERWWDGFLPAWFSLEIASFGGDVRFFIRTQPFLRQAIEAHIYSQFPDIEIKEAEDYTVNIPYNKTQTDWDLWGGTFQLTKDDHYPIKTYVDYGLDKSPKEEFKVDPLTPTLEVFGGIGPGEQIWSQILIKATGKRFKKEGSWFKKADWKDGAKKELAKLQKKDKPKEGETINLSSLMPTIEDKVASEAIERSLEKIAFDCGWRMLYLAPKDRFNKGVIAGMIGSTKQFGSQHLNGFKPLETVGFLYPWQDITGNRTKRQKWRFFDAYRRRSYFFSPYSKDKKFILTTEELATIYHFPGQVATTPTLERIGSKRSEPPTNLPF